MTDRATQIDAFLNKTVWATWQRAPIAGDASGRRYLRLTQGTQSVIVMDAPPETGEKTQPFLDIAQMLKSHGLCPPDVLAHDVVFGFMVLSDLGETDFAKWLNTTPQDAKTLYRSAADVIISLQNIAPPSGLVRMTPEVGADMIQIVGSHYSNKNIADVTSEMKQALATFAPEPVTLALRDFHAENLIWRPAHQGTDRVGLLDFQDAFVAPAGYDLASLLKDARRDVAMDIADDLMTYVAEKTNAGTSFKTQVACLGVQRNLRILGVFARLSREHGKTRYLSFMPRVWAHIQHDLNDPALAQLRAAVLETIPAPTPDLRAGLRP